LGRVQRLVRCDEDVLTVGAARLEGRHAQARGDVDALSLEHDACAFDQLAQRFGIGFRTVERRLRQDHAQLFAAVAARDVGSAQPERMTSPTRFNTASPAAWPWPSLMALKWSRSTMISVRGVS